MQLSHSPDLWQLVQDGYEVEVTEGGHLVLSHVPYLTADGSVAFGQLASKLNLAGDQAAYNGAHEAWFVGGVPHDRHGVLLNKLIHQPAPMGHNPLEADLVATVGMSSKPAENYRDYHHKMTTYEGLISSHAEAVDPEATARTFAPTVDEDQGGPFEYLDTASSRAQITQISDKLRLRKVVIIGLGGTGSYVLDLVAKTPIGELHLYDGDDLFTHNAFRAPGAAPLGTLRSRPKKVVYYRDLYSSMKRGIVAHPCNVDESNVEELRDADFVFLTMEGNECKRHVVERLLEFGVPFIDVGVGINIVGDALLGTVQVITRTPTDEQRAPERHQPAYDSLDDDEYRTNIQIADLNALNAALAVIKWKKLFGFYHDEDDEHFSAYTLAWNQLISDDLR